MHQHRAEKQVRFWKSCTTVCLVKSLSAPCSGKSLPAPDVHMHALLQQVPCTKGPSELFSRVSPWNAVSPSRRVPKATPLLSCRARLVAGKGTGIPSNSPKCRKHGRFYQPATGRTFGLSATAYISLISQPAFMALPSG